MNKNVTLIALMLAASMTAGAQTQTRGGGLSEAMLTQIRKAQTHSAADRALFNAMSSNAIDKLAKTHQSAIKPDSYFNVVTPKQSITDQKSSGRCWMFSGLNVLRADFAKRTDSLRVDFSQAYLFFYDQLEKANLFLQGVADCAKKPMDDERVRFFFKAPLSDGGTFCGVADLTAKYGLVPKSVMPETFSSDNTSKMSRLIESKLREYGLQLRDMVAKGKKQADINKAKTEMLATVYHMLALTIGEPPTKFSYAFKNAKGETVSEEKTYTPQSFYAEVVGKPLNGSFIMVMNDPRREYYKTYEVEYDRHTYDGTNWKYLNLPMEEIEKLAITSLKDGKKMYSSYDVGKFLDRENGHCSLDNFDYASLFGTTFGMDKAQRIATYDSGSTHAMTLTAVNLDKNGKPKMWKVEKKYVSDRLQKLADQKPVMVMPEDPLFSEDD